MKLYLVQHGEAMEKGSHPERPLTETGTADIESVARFMARIGVHVSEVWHSGKTRAIQTANILVGQIAKGAKIVVDEELNPKGAVGGLARWLAKRDEDLLITGHMPHLARLAGLLLADEEDAEPLSFCKGAAVCLERGESGHWRVSWMVTPSILRKLT